MYAYILESCRLVSSHNVAWVLIMVENVRWIENEDWW